MKHRHSLQLKRRYKSIVMKEVFSYSKKDIEYISRNIGPLQKGAKLFNESSNINDPRLMPNVKDNEIHFEYGYLGTTIFLLNIIEFGKSYLHKDSYMYPAMFCFRQYIENSIKTIILMYEPNYKSGHDLAESWKKLLRHINKIENDDDEVEYVGSLINELQAIDSRATAFRYPGALNAKYEENPHAFSMLIDVVELKHRVLQVYRFFDRICNLACMLKDEEISSLS